MSTLLVAVEANEESKHILSTAGKAAEQLYGSAAGLHVLTVVRPVAEVYADLNFTPFAEHTAALFKAHARELTETLQEYINSAGVKATGVDVLEGLPEQTISYKARDLEAELVVMGLHNRHGFSRLLGSTTYAVLNHCTNNLLAVHPEGTRDVYRNVLVCVDTSSTCEDVLATALPFISSAEQHRILCVVPPLTTVYASSYAGRSENLAYNQIQDNIKTQTRERIEQAVAAAGLQASLDGDCVALADGDPKATILQAAKDIQADLIVMGSHRRGPLGRLLLGSTVRSVLDHTPCDVFVAGAGEQAEA